MDRHNRVALVVLTTEHFLDFASIYLNLKIIETGSKIASHIFTLVHPFEQNRKIVAALTQRFREIEIVLKTPATLQDLLSRCLITPKIGSYRELLKLGNFRLDASRVKDSSEDLLPALQGPDTYESVHQALSPPFFLRSFDDRRRDTSAISVIAAPAYAGASPKRP